VATIGAPGDPAHVEHVFRDSVAEIEAKGSADVLLAGRKFSVEKQFLDDIRSQKLDTVVGRFHKALLVLHAPGDEVVGIENASQIFTAAKHPKSFVSLDGADHFLTRREDAAFAAGLIAAWAERYIDTGSIAAPDPKAVAGTVVVAETGTGRFASTVVTGSGHVLRADEPAAMGGDDIGATPYDLLLSALGVCKVMTMRMYAQRKGFNLDRAEVRMSHNKIYAKDCEHCETEVGKVDQIRADITLTGDLTDEERQAVFAIAEKCPVHRTITSEVIIEAELVSR
jgi:putative redox protein